MQFDLEAALGRIKQEFIESSGDKLDSIDSLIDSVFEGTDCSNEDFFQLQRDIHSIKGSAGTHGMVFLSLVAHRLEDFIETASTLTKEKWARIQIYIDQMRSLLLRQEEPTESEKESILHILPSAHSKTDSFSNQKKKKVTILIVMPKGVQRKLVGKELAACGFDLSYSDRPVEALKLIMELKPDAIISVQELPDMKGNELANVLKEIQKTQRTPFALLTASTQANFDMPKKAHIIHKSSKFLDQLTDYLVDVGLFGKL